MIQFMIVQYFLSNFQIFAFFTASRRFMYGPAFAWVPYRC